MQEPLPELEMRCVNPECGTVVPQQTNRRKRYCSPACQKKVLRQRQNERFAQLASKVCRECQEDKPIGEFRPPSDLRCRSCMRAIRQDRYQRRGGKEFMYERNLATQYGMTLDEYRKRMADQGGRCAICGDEDKKRLHVDHDHQTGAIRDLLCRWCNYALGNAKDDPKRLRAMADYLERHAGGAREADG